MEMHLARPSNDRRTKQSENVCVLKGVRPGMSVERYNMINGFDTKIITMVLVTISFNSISKITLLL